MLRKLRWRTVGVILTALVLAGGGGGVAYAVTAQVTPSSDVITACVNNVSGTTRIVTGASQCRASEHAVELAASQAPRTVSVDCNTGGSISQTLGAEPVLPPLTIDITGTCTEAVHINRDNVTLRAATDGAGIKAPTSGDTALSVAGTHIILEGLTLTDGERGLYATGGTSISAENLHITGAAFGVFLVDSASARITNTTIEGFSNSGIQLENGATIHVSNSDITGPGAGSGHGIGLNIYGGGTALVDHVHITDCGEQGLQDNGIIRAANSVIENNATGLIATYGGTIIVSDGTVIQSNDHSGALAEGGTVELGTAQVRNNGEQGVANIGGVLNISNGTVIEGNGTDGVQIVANGTARIYGTTIRGNGGSGVYVGDSSVAFFAEPYNTIVNNGGWGVFCEGSPAVAMIRGNPGTVTGNTDGEDNCPAV